MNMNPEQLTTYKSLSPVLRTQTTSKNRKAPNMIEVIDR